MEKLIDTIYRPILSPKEEKSPPKRNFSVFGGLLLLLLVFLAVWYLEPLFNLYRFLKDGRYLMLFGNNAEIRGSGGFLGSFAVLEIRNKKIKKIFFETNVYQKDRGYEAKSQTLLPEFFQDEWKGIKTSFVNSNWPADFREATAQSTLPVYEEIWSDNIDGVAVIQASLVLEALKLTGPILLKDADLAITSENFLKEIQYRVETGYFDDPNNVLINQPKTILADFLPLFWQKLVTLPKREIYTFAQKMLQEKNLVFYFKDETRQRIVEKKNWAGTVVKTGQKNYLYINNTNIGGRKSSLNVKEEVELKVNAENKAVLKIKRRHIGDGKWPDSENKNYTRVYAPYGSELLAGEVRVYEELGKTVFGFWSTVPAGQTKEFVLEYQLPAKINPKVLFWQKQIGGSEIIFNYSFAGQPIFESVLNQDKLIQ
ncbi:DUF4012 domain-containing protein [Candidatus Berkelbacteria bacterium]|nr:DUF4012 domain-containing protein [Candidatus Berkelbacteria bacterium]